MYLRLINAYRDCARSRWQSGEKPVRVQTARGLQHSRGDSFNRKPQGESIQCKLQFHRPIIDHQPGLIRWYPDWLYSICFLNPIKRLIEAQWVAAISELLMNMLLESHEIDWRVQPSLWFSSTERHTLPIDHFHISWGKTHFTLLSSNSIR